MAVLPVFVVSVIIENKPGIADPEGATILSDLVLRGSHSEVSEIRSAKLLRFTIDAVDRNAAESAIRGLCEVLRIYNPVVSKITLETRES